MFGTYLVVTVTDSPSFKEAIVYFGKELELSFTPEIGQTITVKGSPPSIEGTIAQLTAHSIALKEKDVSTVAYNCLLYTSRCV